MTVSPERIKEALRQERERRHWSIPQWREAFGDEWPKAVADTRVAHDEAVDELRAALREAQEREARLREALHEIAGCSLPDQIQEQIALAALAPADEAKP